MLPRVFEFNQEVVKVSHRPAPAILEPAEKEWLVQVLREEAQELEDAEDLVDQIDAVIDSIIFGIGGLYRLGLSREDALACFHAVMDANFQKKAGQKEGRAIAGVADAVKPEGWVAPEARIRAILESRHV